MPKGRPQKGDIESNKMRKIEIIKKKKKIK
jgi:hypothetical protein